MFTFFCAVRSALFVLFMAVTVIPWALAVLVVSVFARGNTVYKLCVGWLTLSIWGAKVICGVHARLHGMERLPDYPVVLLPKHQSTWETFAFPGLMPHPLCYVFKRELLYIPFFGWAMARMDMIHIDRSKRAQAWNMMTQWPFSMNWRPCSATRFQAWARLLRSMWIMSMRAMAQPKNGM